MVVKKNIVTLLLAFIGSIAQAESLDHLHSLITSPRFQDTIVVRGPVVIGIVNSRSGKPARKKAVTVYVDKRKVAVVPTNKYGVWSYTLNNAQQLNNSAHIVEASVALAGNNIMWTQAALFYVNASGVHASHRSGNVSVENSSINFPFGYVNTQTPTIVGSLLDSAYYPVTGETVQVKINGVTVGTVTSNSNGVFSYQVSTPLAEGDYAVSAHCVQSAVDLPVNDFIVDITAPAIPVIVTPTNNSTVNTSNVVVSGTTEANATVTTFLDGSDFGDINYADDSGNWSIEYEGLDNGTHSVAAQATDLANNTGLVSAATSFTISA
jgi:large repetitive protein